MSRLGRNPLDKKPSRDPKTLRPIEIVAEMNSAAAAAAVKEIASAANKERRFVSRLARFMLVDVPAEGIVFGLKAYCLSMSLFD